MLLIFGFWALLCFLAQLSVVFLGKGQYCAKRIIFELSDDLWDIYLDRKDQLALKV